MSPGKLFGPVQGIGCRFGQNFIDERTLARTRNPTYHGKKSDGKGNVNFPKVVRPGRTNDEFGFARPFVLGILFYLLFSGKKGSAPARRGSKAIFQVPRKDQLSSVHSRPGTDFKQVIARQQGVAIMLNHNYGISAIPQPAQNR